jgi:hypothetical protein
MGSVEFAGQESDGPGAQLRLTDPGVDGVASGRPLVLTVHSGMGDVEVRRG